jgi:DNA-binding response OmpR family regulator
VEARILVVEDDDTIGTTLVRALAVEGWTATRVADAAGALETTAGDDAFDLVLLDLGLPDIDGVDLCGLLRAALPGATIVMLTARTDEIDVVVGLDAGADDYLTKPFRLAELLARLRAHVRRRLPVAAETAERLVAGDVSVDGRARRAWVGSTELVLRPKEFDLLAYLVASPGVACTREKIMSDVWDEHWWGSTKTLDIHISALRRKLGEGDANQSRIATLRGVGYRFEGR